MRSTCSISWVTVRMVSPSQTLKGKVVGLIAAGGGGGNVLTALYHSVRALDAFVAPTVVSIGNGVIDLGNDELSDPNAIARLREMSLEVVDLSRRLRLAPASVVAEVS